MISLGVWGREPPPGVGGAHDLERGADHARCRVIVSRLRSALPPVLSLPLSFSPAVPVRLRGGRLTLSPSSLSRADVSEFAGQGGDLGVGAPSRGWSRARWLFPAPPACRPWMASAAGGLAWCVVLPSAGPGVFVALVPMASVAFWLAWVVPARDGRACCRARSVTRCSLVPMGCNSCYSCFAPPRFRPATVVPAFKPRPSPCPDDQQLLPAVPSLAPVPGSDPGQWRFPYRRTTIAPLARTSSVTEAMVRS